MLINPRYGWTIFAAITTPVIIFYLIQRNGSNPLIRKRTTGAIIIFIMLLSYMLIAYLQPTSVAKALLVPQELSKSVDNLDCQLVRFNRDGSLSILGDLNFDGVHVFTVDHLIKGQLTEFHADVYELVRQHCGL